MATTRATTTMQPIVRAAVVGTAKGRALDSATGTPVDALDSATGTPVDALDSATGTPVDALAEGRAAEGLERALLLRAGAWAVYKQAGQVGDDALAPLAVCPAEQLRAPAPAVAELLREVFAMAHVEVWLDAMARLREVGMHLPFTLLPTVLDLGRSGTAVRHALVGVLSERGRWLSRLNRAWAWVGDADLEAGTGIPENAESIWQEGTTLHRLTVLRRVRAVDPARGRDWLAAVWPSESADTRARLLPALEVGLSAEDEAFLEAALDDRGEGVRFLAPSLLARIPTSAFAARVRARADALLDYHRGKLLITPPEAPDPAARRDGIRAKPQRGMGERAWWLFEALKHVPPAHWEERFAATPEALLAAAAKTEWEPSLVQAWANATADHGGAAWVLPLWERIHRPEQKGSPSVVNVAYAGNLASALLRSLPQTELERYALGLLPEAANNGEHLLWRLVAQLPKPWGERFGAAFLAALRQALATLPPRKAERAYHWNASLPVAAVALPPACFAAALAPWPLPDELPLERHPWHYHLGAFTSIVTMRRRIHEEIA